MWQLFAEQTNIYANQFLAANFNLKPRSRARSWVDTNPTEMKTLIGLLILQGIVQKPENGMYFSKRASIVTPIKITQTFSTPWTLLPRHGARDIKEEAYQEMCSLLGQWKEERVIILVF